MQPKTNNTCNRWLCLIFLLSFTSALSAYGQAKEELAPVKTRKGYDFRAKGYDSGMYYIARICTQTPVLIAVATKDDKFIEAIIEMIRNMDDEGYEEISLLLYDRKPQNSEETHSVMFIKKGEVVGGIKGSDDGWTLIQTKENTKSFGIDLKAPKNSYPLDIIRTKIRTTHEGSGAANFTASGEKAD